MPRGFLGDLSAVGQRAAAARSPHEPTPLRALLDPQFRGDVLANAAAYLSDPENAMRVGSLATTGVPLLSDVLGLGADALMYARKPEERTLGNFALTGIGALPFVPAMAGIFAGKGAKTADVVKLAQAQQMAAKGADPVEVWRATGWTNQFPDGKWRFEIDDSKAVYRPGAAAEKALKGAKSQADQYEDAQYLRGFMDREGVSVGDAKERFRETFSREPHQFAGQHAKAMTFAELSDALKKAEANAPSRLNWAATVGDVLQHGKLKRAYPDEMAGRFYIEQPREAGLGGKGSFGPGGIGLISNEAYALESGKSTTLHELQHAIQQREGFARGGSPESALIDLDSQIRELRSRADDLFQQSRAKKVIGTADEWKKREEGLSLEKRARELESMRVWADFSPHEAYRRLAGEAEARLTQKRMNYTPQQRQQIAPWTEFDVPREQQIVRDQSVLDAMKVLGIE